MENKINNLNINKIKTIIPNRYPYLLIDFVNEVVPGKYVKAIKNLTANEWYFPVHFPEEPMMPGMVQMEALLQALSLTILTMDEHKGKIIRCIGADKIKLRKRVVPGSQLDIEATLFSCENGLAIGAAKGIILNEEVCSAKFTVRIEECEA